MNTVLMNDMSPQHAFAPSSEAGVSELLRCVEKDPEALPMADPETVAEAFSTWGQEVWRFLRSSGVPERAAVDVTQDVFLIAHECWTKYRGESSRKAWLFGIAMNTARNARRRYERAGEDPALLGTEVLERTVLAPESGDPFESASRNEAAAILREIIAKLSEQDRQLFVLVAFHEMKVVESSALLGLGASYARQRLLRIRAWLSDELERVHARDSWRLR
jgi:RNA polymerase sigma-70 factor (ECF subfamily)